MVITVGYFCSGGYTETGAIQFFLEKINPSIRWKRCFPTALKPSAKKGRKEPIPISSHSGVSGIDLVEQMLQRLKHPNFEWDQKYDFILMIDDMDCRFEGQDIADVFQSIIRLNDKVNQCIGRQIDFDFLFAAPEIESWLVMDWSHSFAKEYPKLEIELRLRLKKMLSKHFECIEGYGGPLVNGGCENKLSDLISEHLTNIQLDRRLDFKYTYSKRINGCSMLQRIRPEEVEKKCRLYFATTYRRLSSLGYNKST